MQQKAGLKLAEEAIQYRPTSAGQYRQPTSHKQVLAQAISDQFENVPVPFLIHQIDSLVSMTKFFEKY